MNYHKQLGDCIEWRRAGGDCWYWSVSEYDSVVARGREMTYSDRSWSGLSWTTSAPKVEELTVEGNNTIGGTFRIFDWDVYDAQMRALIGIA